MVGRENLSTGTYYCISEYEYKYKENHRKNHLRIRERNKRIKTKSGTDREESGEGGGGRSRDHLGVFIRQLASSTSTHLALLRSPTLVLVIQVLYR